MYFEVDTKRYKNLMKRLCESVSKKLCEKIYVNEETLSIDKYTTEPQY